MILAHTVSAFVHSAVRGLGSVLLVLAVMVGTVFAQGTEEDVRALLEQRDHEIKQVLGTGDTFTNQQREQLKDLVNGVIDFRAMSEAALGSAWESLSDAQREEFVEVFSEIVRTQSLADLEIYRAPVTYEEINVTGDSAYVLTTTVYKEVPAKVEYILGYTPEAGWQAHDIILDDVSTVESYARSFQSVIRKRGFDALMASLHKKLDSLETSS